jgi:DNA-binding winged helix-turn-helix (wHTH) protein
MENETLSALSLYQGMSLSENHCLVVLWHRENPDCVGSVAFLPLVGTRRVGRGSGSDLRWIKHNPENRPNPEVHPFESPRISRHQLDIRVEEKGIHLHNLGRCALRIDGAPCTEGWVNSGQLVSLDREAIMLVTRRARVFPAVEGFDQAFGEADPWGWRGEGPATWDIRRQLVLARSTTGHVLVRGETGTGRSRVARCLGAQPYTWRDSDAPPKSGDLWVSHPVQWFKERPDEAQTLLKTMQADGRRAIVTLEPHEQGLTFKQEALFPVRVTLPGLTERLSDIVFIAAEIMRELRHASPKTEDCFVDGQPMFTPEWVQFLVGRRWTAHGAELRALLLDAVHRSKNGWMTPPEESPVARGVVNQARTPLTLADCVIDFQQRQVVRGDQVTGLTPIEVQVLLYFSERLNQEVSKADLLQNVWEYKPGLETQAVKNTIRRLRRKIEPDSQNPVYLQSIRGVGYRFVTGV